MMMSGGRSRRSSSAAASAALAILISLSILFSDGGVLQEVVGFSTSSSSFKTGRGPGGGNGQMVARLRTAGKSSGRLLFPVTTMRGVQRDDNPNDEEHSSSINNLNDQRRSTTTTRRQLLNNVVSVMAAAATTITGGGRSLANAAEDGADDPLTDVYFGVGCFWHSQHEFVEAERKLLKRTDDQLTSRTGYAGGKSTDGEGRVCYHNFQRIADYGKLGHGEVVGMTIPQSTIGDFTSAYFDQFSPRGDRMDPQDKGLEYRSLMGLPGGTNHPMFPTVQEVAKSRGYTLVKGKGNDPDTLGTKQVYVYDTSKFPFYQAEVYHQFHNDFQTPAYGKKYNDLVREAFRDGRVKDTFCPDRFPEDM